MRSNIILRGYPASPGLVKGKIKILSNKIEVIQEYDVNDIEKEVERFLTAIEESKRELLESKKNIKETVGDQYEEIFEAQILALEDMSVIEKSIKNIRETKKNAESVYKNVVSEILEKMQKTDNKYLKERSFDIIDVMNRVLKRLKNRDEESLQSFEEIIIGAFNLTPTETMKFDKKSILGIVTESGGMTSHSSILARALNIPAVVNVKNFLSNVNDGDIAIVDGYTGTVIIDPDENSEKTFKKRKEEYKNYNLKLMEMKDEESVTIDGRNIDLSTNIELLEELGEVKKYGGRGIGLFRTEFIFLEENGYPTVEKQENIYRKIAESVFPDSVIIRTVDIGGDKPIYVRNKEENPFLGFRGIRVSLGNEKILRDQFKAILKASSKKNLKIMLPMVSKIDEVIKAKMVLDDIKKELFNQQIDFDKDIELGIMVEVPSAAIMAEEFAKYVDFFSLGTNDLTQYTLAVDRNNNNVSSYFDSLDPAVLKLIKFTIDAAHEANIWAGVCGELSSDPIAIPILVGLGVDELSMSPIFIPEIKMIIKQLSYEETKEIAKNALLLKSSEKVREYMKGVISEKFPNLIKYFLGEFYDK
ncbi:MAG: phosphoenolpyruvate--protein phosphotransferase [candidate division WOR-3 bacterium]